MCEKKKKKEGVHVCVSRCEDISVETCCHLPEPKWPGSQECRMEVSWCRASHLVSLFPVCISVFVQNDLALFPGECLKEVTKWYSWKQFVYSFSPFFTPALSCSGSFPAVIGWGMGYTLDTSLVDYKASTQAHDHAHWGWDTNCTALFCRGFSGIMVDSRIKQENCLLGWFIWCHSRSQVQQSISWRRFGKENTKQRVHTCRVANVYICLWFIKNMNYSTS